MTETYFDLRKKAVLAAKQGFRQYDLALDKFAANKDDEAATCLAFAREKIDTALRLLNVQLVAKKE